MVTSFARPDAHSIQKGADIYMNKKRVPHPPDPRTLEAAATARRGGVTAEEGIPPHVHGAF
jgi:hypothetical protein